MKKMEKKEIEKINIEKINMVDREYWDIVKGIGIILVVVGHLCWDLTRYIYLFHLPLFFFVSGYLYSEEKYGDNPYLNVANRLKSSWMKYVLIFWILILMHNFLMDLKLIWVYGDIYSPSDIAQKMAEAVFGLGGEAMACTIWFVPASVIATCILGFIVTFSRKVHTISKNKPLKYASQFVLIMICTLVGYYFERKHLSMPAYAHVSLVVMPFLWIGYLIRTYKLQIKAYLNVFAAVICGVFVYATSLKYRLDLAIQWVYPYMHMVAFFGIYMCLWLAKVVQNIVKLKDVIALYGKASFWIMFVHINLCRIFDWAYINIHYKDKFEEMYYVIDTVIFPDRFWPLYLFIGLGVSMFLYLAYGACKDFLKKKKRTVL